MWSSRSSSTTTSKIGLELGDFEGVYEVAARALEGRRGRQAMKTGNKVTRSAIAPPARTCRAGGDVDATTDRLSDPRAPPLR